MSAGFQLIGPSGATSSSGETTVNPPSGSGTTISGQVDSIIGSLLSQLSDKFDFESAQDAGFGAGPGGGAASSQGLGRSSGGGGQNGGQHGGQQGGQYGPDGADIGLGASGSAGIGRVMPSSSQGGESESGLGGEMETLIQILMALLGSDAASAEDKGKILDFLEQLKGMVAESGTPEMKAELDNMLQGGYEMLSNDNDMSPGDLMNLGEIVNGDAGLSTNESVNAYNNSVNDVKNGVNAVNNSVNEVNNSVNGINNGT